MDFFALGNVQTLLHIKRILYDGQMLVQSSPIYAMLYLLWSSLPSPLPNGGFFPTFMLNTLVLQLGIL
jgi:hypothetical protein